MSRVSYVMMHPGGDVELTAAVRECLDQLVGDLCAQADASRDDVLELVVVGNPIMHHLVFGFDPTELGGAPFAPVTDRALTVPARDLGVTVGVTVVSTVIVLALALGIALNLRLRGGRLASIFAGLAVVPLFIPVVIASWAILTFYSGDGFVRTVFALFGLTGPTWGYTTVAVVIGSVWTSLPFATLMAVSGVQSVPDAMIEAARDAGASSFAVITRVLVPLSAIPLVIAATFTAIGVLGSFTVPYFTGPNAPSMLGVDISKYFQAYNRPQQSTAMAFIVFAFAAAASVFYLRSTVRSNAGELDKKRQEQQ
jgi:ABC-type spermidine/putrescine transport system permease subunit I